MAPKWFIFISVILESELKSAVVFLVCWEPGEKIFGIFDPHKAKMRRLLDRWAEGKGERKQTKKENKGKKKARRAQVYF